MRQNELNVHETIRKAQLKNMRHVYSELSNTKALIDDAIESKFLIIFVFFSNNFSNKFMFITLKYFSSGNEGS